MSSSCRNPACFPDIPCALGHINRDECNDWLKSDDQAAQPKAEPAVLPLPWSGYALGTKDIGRLASRGQPIVIGVVGAHDSGKTSLFSYFYLWLLRTGRFFEWDFAGSWTFGAWETIARNCRWDIDSPPSFPPHTTTEGRTPGLLHISLRDGDGRLRDVLFADTPGEWFTRWSQKPNADSSSGARWVFQNATALLLMADSGALADSEKFPSARRWTRELIEQVSSYCGQTPVLFNWSKSDVQIPSARRQSIEDCRKRYLEKYPVSTTTFKEPGSIAECMAQLVKMSLSARKRVRVQEKVLTDDSFLAFRGNTNA